MSLEQYFRRVLPRFLYPGGQKRYTPSISHVVYAQSYTKFDLLARLQRSGRVDCLVLWRSSLFPNEWCPYSLVDMVSTNNPGHRESTIHTGIKLHCTVCATPHAQIENSATTCDALLEFMTFRIHF